MRIIVHHAMTKLHKEKRLVKKRIFCMKMRAVAPGEYSTITKHQKIPLQEHAPCTPWVAESRKL